MNYRDRVFEAVRAAPVGTERVGLPADLWAELKEHWGDVPAEGWTLQFRMPRGAVTLFPLDGMPAPFERGSWDADGRPVEGA